MRLRLMMAIILAVALILAVGAFLRRRSGYLLATSTSYSQAAGRLEERLPQLAADEVQPLLDRAHWNDSVAGAYRHAAIRPWVLGDPDPAKITCQCSYHAKLAPIKPGP